ncbi:hypothetical protein [Joostella sp.]|uniref:hypothetical protein n=1 Tax=Joostella sp. TaxID=2231138 RepID=UPI003A909E25
MKTLLFPFVFLLAMIFLSGSPEKIIIKDSLQGTWELESRYSYDGNIVIDTIKNSDGYRQIKMYQNDKVMWTRFVPKDSMEWFGYGSYYITDNSLVERLEYGSESMMNIIDTMRVFTFKLEVAKNSFSQITLDGEGNPLFSENYKRLK